MTKTKTTQPILTEVVKEEVAEVSDNRKTSDKQWLFPPIALPVNRCSKCLDLLALPSEQRRISTRISNLEELVVYKQYSLILCKDF